MEIFDSKNQHGGIGGSKMIIHIQTYLYEIWYYIQLNFYKSFSIIIMALVDWDYCFTFVDVGAQGRTNDVGVFTSTTMYRIIIRNEPLPGRQKPVPYVFIGDILLYLDLI